AVKIMVYKPICITTLLYGNETWVTYYCHLKTLERFHQRCLLKILRINWEDRCTNSSVLIEAKTSSTEAMILQNQLRWTGHCIRMPNSRLPKQVLYSQLSRGQRICEARGRDTLKTCLRKGQISFMSAGGEVLARERPLWHHMICQTPTHFETYCLSDEADKRRRRKEKGHSQNGTSCPHCSKICGSGIGLLSHLRTHNSTAVTF
uniref:C2H2-type domain-containing protein n=1 Tax=Lepisosteus oculatus TaxID=7918 RepID=W5N9J4_LEPOC